MRRSVCYTNVQGRGWVDARVRRRSSCIAHVRTLKGAEMLASVQSARWGKAILAAGGAGLLLGIMAMQCDPAPRRQGGAACGVIGKVDNGTCETGFDCVDGRCRTPCPVR